MMAIKFVVVFLFEAERTDLIAGICPMHLFFYRFCSGSREIVKRSHAEI